MRYSDALQTALEAVRAGEDLESVLARLPRHASRLREDLRLSDAVRRYSRTQPGPSADSLQRASVRLMAQLQTERTAAAAPARPLAGRLRGFGLTRLALAATVVALALVGLGLFAAGGNQSAEAATIEGVVVQNEGDALTVQTLDALEEVTVPENATVADASGAPIALAGITPGEVVSIKVQRQKDRILARHVAKVVGNIEAWCGDNSQRCQQLGDRLDQAQAQCQSRPASCRPILEEINSLRRRTAEASTLADLRARCGAANAERACGLLAGFCQEHQVVCGALIPQAGAARQQSALLDACRQGDSAACRQLVQLCASNSACPAGSGPSKGD